MMFTISLRIVNAVSALAIEIAPQQFPFFRWTWSANKFKKKLAANICLILLLVLYFQCSFIFFLLLLSHSYFVSEKEHTSINPNRYTKYEQIISRRKKNNMK